LGIAGKGETGWAAENEMRHARRKGESWNLERGGGPKKKRSVRILTRKERGGRKDSHTPAPQLGKKKNRRWVEGGALKRKKMSKKEIPLQENVK